MPEQVKSLSVEKLSPIVSKIQEVYPKISIGRDKCIAALSNISEVQTDEQRQELSDLIVTVRNTYDKVVPMRKSITEVMDEIKSILMQPEKDIDAAMTQARQILAKYDQAKIDAEKKAIEDARVKKERENYKIELATEFRKKLGNLVIDIIQRTNTGSAKLFSEMTLDNYDEQSKRYLSYKVILKPEYYEACFSGAIGSKITDDEFKDLVAKIKAEEPYEKWNDAVVAELLPVINEWKAKLPQVKENLIALANAKEEDRKKLEAEQKRKTEEDEARRKKELEARQQEINNQLEQRAEVDRFENEFQEQGSIQKHQEENGEIGPVKLIAKFRNDKTAVKTLCEMIYQSCMHPKFPGFVKKDKKGTDQVDENGFPVYNDYVAPWMSFVIRYGNPKIEGLETKEVAKVIIRK